MAVELDEKSHLARAREIRALQNERSIFQFDLLSDVAKIAVLVAWLASAQTRHEMHFTNPHAVLFGKRLSDRSVGLLVDRLVGRLNFGWLVGNIGWVGR